jgi:hydrogenase maturation protease
MSASVRILACGAIDRGDDGAALLAVRRLPATARRAACVEEIGQLSAEHLLGSPGSRTVVVDCVRGVPAGSIVELPLGELPALEASLRVTSTHALSAGGAVGLAAALGGIGSQDRFLGIGGESFVVGGSPSPAVADQLGALVERLVALALEPPLPEARPCV